MCAVQGEPGLATLEWVGDTGGYLRLIDQTQLPNSLVHVECRDVGAVVEAIKALRVRGAPAIGIAAAYGVCIGIQEAAGADRETVLAKVDACAAELATSRPTAVNLFWALERMRQTAREENGSDGASLVARLLEEAKSIESEDRAMCRAIGEHGAALLGAATTVMTHCNAGGLATADYGTALAVFFAAHDQGRPLRVFVDETRPLLQGARLTAWELGQRGIRSTLICDSMAAHVMKHEQVDAVVTGADRIAANGDAANKIGTYGLALLAEAHGVPFYIAAPTSTFDLSLATGDEIPIEERDPREITHGFGRQTAPEGVEVYNPAFDVTPARLIRAIVCERGVISPVTQENVAAMVSA